MDLAGQRVIDQPVVGVGELPYVSMGDLGLDKAKVTQCALSRICAVCAATLERPVAFLGTEAEADANAFHLPAMHLPCAEVAHERWAQDWSASLGQPSRPSAWSIVTTSGFEFIRMATDAADRRPVFSPNSVLGRRDLPA